MKPTSHDPADPLRRILDAVLEFSEESVRLREIRRNMTKNIFLLGIEIGRASSLTPTERFAYTKTLRTVQALALMQHEQQLLDEERPEGFTEAEHNRQAIAATVTDWLENEPEVRKCLEKQFKCNLDEMFDSDKIPPDMQRTLAKVIHAVAAASPETISEGEVNSIIEKLEHPLDRP